MAASIEFKMPQNNPIKPEQRAKKKPAQRARSKGQLEHRSSAILPFSAWVEPHRGPVALAHGAREEELRLKKIVQEKEERLREFQQEVKARVRNLEQMKRDEQHGMSVEAFEVERNVVQQSSLPSTVRRDNCVYRDDSELKIQRSATRDYSAVDAASHLLEEHAQKIRNCSKHARNVLSSKSLGAEVEELSKQLPGGLWRISPTRDHAISRQRSEKVKPQEQIAKDDVENDYWIGENAIEDQIFNHERWISESDFPGKEGQRSALHPEKRVHFEGDENVETINSDWNRLQKQAGDPKEKKTAKGVEVLLQPSKLLEEKKARAKSQVAVYRRLFMDIEREQVRENIRMKQHRRRMENLKVQKEVERLEIEQRQIEKLKMQRVRKEEESFLRARKEKKHEVDSAKTRRKLQKEKETERFIEALQAILKEKVLSRNIDLPPLCSCGPTIWDTNPETCANNCVFYKNPKAYAKALSTVLGSANLE